MLPKSMKNMSKKDQIVNFYPVFKKGPNYIKYCIGWLSNEEKPRSKRECICFLTRMTDTSTRIPTTRIPFISSGIIF